MDILMNLLPTFITYQLLEMLELALVIRRGLVGKDVDVDGAAPFLLVEFAFDVEEKCLEIHFLQHRRGQSGSPSVLEFDI